MNLGPKKPIFIPGPKIHRKILRALYSDALDCIGEMARQRMQHWPCYYSQVLIQRPTALILGVHILTWLVAPPYIDSCSDPIPKLGLQTAIKALEWGRSSDR